jgi:hypothetical protein
MSPLTADLATPDRQRGLGKPRANAFSLKNKDIFYGGGGALSAYQSSFVRFSDTPSSPLASPRR